MAVRWDTRSAVWIDTLPIRFPNDMTRLMGQALRAEADWVIREARATAPKFEGDLARDLGFSLNFRPQGGVSITFGESGNLAVNEAGAKYQPFSYPLAKEQGAKPHKVWLFASDTKARQKLRRWAFQSGRWPVQPKDWAEYREAQKSMALPPPYVFVTVTGHHFLYPLGEPYVQKVIEYIKTHIARVW